MPYASEIAVRWPGLPSRALACGANPRRSTQSNRSAALSSNDFDVFASGSCCFAERIVRAHMLAACDHRLRGFHARHVNGDHVFVAFAAIRSKEYGERRRMRVQFRRHVGAGQLRETHMHVGVVRDGSLSARHRHHAVFDENDLRVRLQQRRVEQVGFVASRNLIVDVALRKWQERQCLGQRQWREHAHRLLLSLNTIDRADIFSLFRIFFSIFLYLFCISDCDIDGSGGKYRLLHPAHQREQRVGNRLRMLVCAEMPAIEYHRHIRARACHRIGDRRHHARRARRILVAADHRNRCRNRRQHIVQIRAPSAMRSRHAMPSAGCSLIHVVNCSR